MTSLPVPIAISPSDDPNVPRTVNLGLMRVASRVEINAHTTPKFAENYPGSKLVIDSISISSMPRVSKLDLVGEGQSATTIDEFHTMTQLPVDRVINGTTHHNFIFYCYENVQKTGSLVRERPTLNILATFDFDGDLATTEDAIKVKYSKTLAMSNNKGEIFRNTLYQIEVMLDGLTSREVISSIKVLPWNTVNEEIHFGG